MVRDGSLPLIGPHGSSGTLAAVEPRGLWFPDREVWRKHCGHTLAEWGRRFAANRDKARAIFDVRFCRMWELYPISAETSLMTGRMAVMHLQLGRERDAVPLSRGYIGEASARLRSHESPAAAPAALRA